MKKTILLTTLTAFLLCGCNTEDTILERVYIGPLFYNINVSKKTAEVTFEHGSWEYGGNYDDLKEVTIPSSVVYEGITYPVTYISYGAFLGSGLTSIDIPNSITGIGRYCFAWCKFSSVTIPSSVTYIGAGAFDKCSNLTSFINLAPTPQEIDSTVFEEVSFTTCTLYVPEESITAYKEAPVWKEFRNIQKQ